MKDNMPLNKNHRPEGVKLSKEATQAAERFIKDTEWNAFWNRVVERTIPEVEAYEKARIKSMQTAPQQVFM
jgi:hypothetical protein